jgi:[ribosomal protein S18]-alanine N-acetyltransferase
MAAHGGARTLANRVRGVYIRAARSAYFVLELELISLPHISLAAAAHARGIAEMSREYIEYGLGWSWTQARVLKAIQDDSTNVAVVQERTALVAFGIMRYGEERAHLVLLGVAAGHRKRGLGALLLAWLEKSAVTAGLERVQLEARADNPDAIAFYLEQGYGRAGTVPGYYRGAVDAVRLEKRLWVPAGAAP